MSLLAGTVVSVQEIKSDAAKFFHVFTQKTHHISNVTHHIQKSGVHEGQHGAVGSILHFDFTHGGESKDVKEVIDAIDEEKHLITLRVIEGHILDEYNTFMATMQATDKEDGTGSKVRWSIEYERKNAKVLAPTSFLDICIHLSEGLDQHIQEEAMATA